MTATAEFEQEFEILSAFMLSDAGQSLPDEEGAAALIVVYQQIADRRAKVEDAEILRRARAL